MDKDFEEWWQLFKNLMVVEETTLKGFCYRAYLRGKEYAAQQPPTTAHPDCGDPGCCKANPLVCPECGLTNGHHSWDCDNFIRTT